MTDMTPSPRAEDERREPGRLAAWADHPVRASVVLAGASTALAVLALYVGWSSLADTYDRWLVCVWAAVAAWLGGGLVAGFLLGQRALLSYPLAHAAVTVPGLTLLGEFYFFGVGGDGHNASWSGWLSSLVVVEAVGLVPVVVAMLLGALARAL
jgi:hypothetical protein